jgi:predicted MFS family arabinose efflux permease
LLEKKKGILSALIIFLALFAIGVDNYIMIAILPQLANDFGKPSQLMGFLGSAYALPLALLSPLLGPFSDRFGRKFAMSGGMAIFVVAALGSSLAPAYEFLMLARFINGVGAALFVPAAYAYVAESAKPEKRAQHMSTILMAFPASALIGLPLGGFIASFFGWRAVFGFIGLVGVLALAGLSTLKVARPVRPTGLTMSYWAGLRQVLAEPSVLKVVGVTLVWMTAANGSITYIGQFFHEKYNFNSDQIGLVLMVIGVVGITATRVSARFIGLVGTRRAVLSGLSTCGIAIIILPWTNLVALSILVLGVWVFGIWFGFPAQQTIASGLVLEARGTVLSFNTSAQYLGGVVGPIISGLMLDGGGFPLLGLWGSFLLVCAFVLAFQVLPGRSYVRLVQQPLPKK